MDMNILVDQKRKILENINYAKEIKINKISALLVCNEEEIQKELLSWLIFEGYKVSLIKDDVNILTIEW
ncbi:hypothetical protein ACQPUY_01555 [Clostridium nigeriense]|uniref:hypothetical protein n=1 Tax=Clostridium nigeriense TaxID=1805470 RepID=UPI003D331FAD